MNKKVLDKEGTAYLVEKIKENFVAKKDLEPVDELPEVGEPGRIYIIPEKKYINLEMVYANDYQQLIVVHDGEINPLHEVESQDFEVGISNDAVKIAVGGLEFSGDQGLGYEDDYVDQHSRTVHGWVYYCKTMATPEFEQIVLDNGGTLEGLPVTAEIVEGLFIDNEGGITPKFTASFNYGQDINNTTQIVNNYTQYIYTEENGWEEIGGNNTQYEDMPEPSSDNVGQIIQYTGENSEELEQGHFYICKEEEISGIINYYWEEINVQDAIYTAGEGIDITNNKISSTMPIYTVDTATYADPFIIEGKPLGLYLFKYIPAPCLSGYSGGSKQSIQLYNGFVLLTNTTIDHDSATYQQVGYAWGSQIDSTYGNIGNYCGTLSVYGTTGRTIVGNSSNTFAVPASGNSSISGIKTFSTLPESSVVPTINNQLVNKKYVDDTVASAMSAAIKREIVQELPVSDIKTDTIYMVPAENPGTENVYDEFMYINNAWEKIGDTEVDLSNYVTTTAMETYVEENATQQVTTMPTADSSNVGEIVQYVGTTSGDLQSGHFYICTQEAGSGMPVYTWTEILVQDGVVTAPVPQGITDVTYGAYRSYPGYSSTGTQTLKNINGILTWVDEGTPSEVLGESF